MDSNDPHVILMYAVFTYAHHTTGHKRHVPFEYFQDVINSI